MLLFFRFLHIFFLSLSLSLLSSEYTIDDKKLLELDESFTTYDSDDINSNTIDLNTIVTRKHDIFNSTPKTYLDKWGKNNWEKTNLLHFFNAYNRHFSECNDASENLKKTVPKKIYYVVQESSLKSDNYYGINPITLLGYNFIGKITMKIRDDPTYIKRVSQKIDISNEEVNQLFENAQSLVTQRHVQRKPWGPSNANTIYFYDQDKGFYAFTNFFKSQIYADGAIWPTAEHYYQAMKFTKNPNIQQEILKRGTIQEALDYVNTMKKKRDNDWENTYKQNMVKIIWLKFNQHETLKTLLLKTGSNILVEDSENTLTGMGKEPNYIGKNWLGCILMAIRERLIMQDNEPVHIPPHQISQSPVVEQPAQPNPQSYLIPEKKEDPLNAKSNSPKQGFFASLWESLWTWLWTWLVSWFTW